MPYINGVGSTRPLAIRTPNRSEIVPPYMAPGTETERRLVRIWAEVLSHDRVGVHDNFFDLGGHSLAATLVLSQVIKQLQLKIPLRVLFDSPTIADIAQVIDEYQGQQIRQEEFLSEIEGMSDKETEELVGGKTRSENQND